jgi:FHA domain
MPICPKGHNSATDDYCDECGAPIGGPGESGIAGAFGASGTAGASGESAAADQVCPVCGSPRIGRFCEEDGYDFVLRPPISPAPAAPVAAAPGSAVSVAAGPPSAASAAAEPASVAAAPADAEPATSGQPETETSARTRGRLASPAASHEPFITKPWVAVVTADRDYFETVIAQSGPDAASITFPAVCPERRIQLTGGEVLIGRHSASRGLNPHIDLSGPPEDPGVSRLHAVLQSTTDGGWTITDPGSTNGVTINDDTQPIEVGVPVQLRPGDRIHVGAWTTLTLTQP